MVKASTQRKRLEKPDYGRERIEILYEDSQLAVIYKPEGMLSVPYPGSRARTAVDVLEQMLRRRGAWSASHRPFVVHRLDRETSGVMMFAMTETAKRKIMDSWHTMVTERIYRAVAENPPPGRPPLPDAGVIDDGIAYNARNVGFVPHGDAHPADNAATRKAAARRGRASRAGEASVYERGLTMRNGRPEFKTIPARTHFKVVARGQRHTLFELSLDTGRKNQIRAHLAGRGYPLAGDENYLARTDPFGRLALHARTLEFDHPFTGERMKFERPEPAEWLAFVEEAPPTETPVWLERRSSSKGRRGDAAELSRRPSGKQLASMDFIRRGQLLRKK